MEAYENRLFWFNQKNFKMYSFQLVELEGNIK